MRIRVCICTQDVGRLHVSPVAGHGAAVLENVFVFCSKLGRGASLGPCAQPSDRARRFVKLSYLIQRFCVLLFSLFAAAFLLSVVSPPSSRTSCTAAESVRKKPSALAIRKKHSGLRAGNTARKSAYYYHYHHYHY